MKKWRLGCFILAAAWLLAGCGVPPGKITVSGDGAAKDAPQETGEEENEESSGLETTSWRESVQRMFEDPYGDYSETGGEIAFLADGPVEDGGYNEAVYNGVQMYALGAGISFSYYTADPNAPESYREVAEKAVEDNARLLVCAGALFGETVGALQETYPQTSFLLIDSLPLDEEGNELPLNENVHCIFFHEEQAKSGFCGRQTGARGFALWLWLSAGH